MSAGGSPLRDPSGGRVIPAEPRFISPEDPSNRRRQVFNGSSSRNAANVEEVSDRLGRCGIEFRPSCLVRHTFARVYSCRALVPSSSSGMRHSMNTRVAEGDRPWR